jgi:hypothetical protein
LWYTLFQAEDEMLATLLLTTQPEIFEEVVGR